MTRKRMAAGFAAAAAFRSIAKKRSDALDVRIQACKARMKSRARLAVAVAVALSSSSQSDLPEDRRQVVRALGKWRGSTVGGYLFHGDDKTYMDNFRTHVR